MTALALAPVGFQWLFRRVFSSSFFPGLPCCGILIAGTYTPFMVVTLRGGWGWSLFGAVWGLAILGIILKAMFTGRFRIFSTLVYLAMGWLALIAFRPLAQVLPAGGLTWLVAGGVLYSVGAALYAWKTLPGHHAAWHVLVLAAP